MALATALRSLQQRLGLVECGRQGRAATAGQRPHALCAGGARRAGWQQQLDALPAKGQ